MRRMLTHEGITIVLLEPRKVRRAIKVYCSNHNAVLCPNGKVAYDDRRLFQYAYRPGGAALYQLSEALHVLGVLSHARWKEIRRAEEDRIQARDLRNAAEEALINMKQCGVLLSKRQEQKLRRLAEWKLSMR